MQTKRLCAGWMPRLLTPNQKEYRVVDSERFLEMFKRNLSAFLHRSITMDEAWIHLYTLEFNRKSGEWLTPGESQPKCPKTQRSHLQMKQKIILSRQCTAYRSFNPLTHMPERYSAKRYWQNCACQRETRVDTVFSLLYFSPTIRARAKLQIYEKRRNLEWRLFDMLLYALSPYS